MKLNNTDEVEVFCIDEKQVNVLVYENSYEWNSNNFGNYNWIPIRDVVFIRNETDLFDDGVLFVDKRLEKELKMIEYKEQHKNNHKTVYEEYSEHSGFIKQEPEFEYIGEIHLCTCCEHTYKIIDSNEEYRHMGIMYNNYTKGNGRLYNKIEILANIHEIESIYVLKENICPKCGSNTVKCVRVYAY